MFGAIIGDIVGSRFEVYAHKSKQFELLTDECRATDDSMMTIAIAKALMDAEKTMQEGSNDSERYYYQVLRETAIQAMQEIGRKFQIAVMVECLLSGYLAMNHNLIKVLVMDLQ